MSTCRHLSILLIILFLEEIHSKICPLDKVYLDYLSDYLGRLERPKPKGFQDIRLDNPRSKVLPVYPETFTLQFLRTCIYMKRPLQLNLLNWDTWCSFYKYFSLHFSACNISHLSFPKQSCMNYRLSSEAIL